MSRIGQRTRAEKRARRNSPIRLAKAALARAQAPAEVLDPPAPERVVQLGPVVVSTARTMGTAPQKDGKLLSPSYLAWVRALECAIAGISGPSDPHHFPPKGGRRICDLLVMPVSREAHGRCQRYEIPKLTQRAHVGATLERFFRTAPRAVVVAVLREALASLDGSP